jgi:hypothetical protein
MALYFLYHKLEPAIRFPHQSAATQASRPALLALFGHARRLDKQ